MLIISQNDLRFTQQKSRVNVKCTISNGKKEHDSSGDCGVALFASHSSFSSQLSLFTRKFSSHKSLAVRSHKMVAWQHTQIARWGQQYTINLS